jgi:polysaccharide biosynthesis/export protein
MHHKYLPLLGLAVLLGFGASMAGAQGVPPAENRAAPGTSQNLSPPVLQPKDARYQLRISDVVEISFRFTPEYNQTVTIQPDGFINLRDLPDLRVDGKTIPELLQILQKSYSKILHDPEVTVVLKDFEKPYFIANGELGHPGKYELRDDTTVMEAIGIAGGFNEKSKHSQVLLFRRLSDEWTEVKKIDMKKMLKTADLSEDLHLRPGDMIYVPKNTMSKIKQYLPTSSVGAYAYPW